MPRRRHSSVRFSHLEHTRPRSVRRAISRAVTASSSRRFSRRASAVSAESRSISWPTRPGALSSGKRFTASYRRSPNVLDESFNPGRFSVGYTTTAAARSFVGAVGDVSSSISSLGASLATMLAPFFFVISRVEVKTDVSPSGNRVKENHSKEGPRGVRTRFGTESW